MKQIKYLNFVLTVIAICLLLITLAVTGLLPSAKAETTKNVSNVLMQVPVNEDGSINVKLSKSDVLDVNISSCDADAFYPAEPIQVKIK